MPRFKFREELLRRPHSSLLHVLHTLANSFNCVSLGRNIKESLICLGILNDRCCLSVDGQDDGTVVLANSDHVDKLEVVAHRSIAVRADIHSPDRVRIGFVSKPCCAAAGDSRVAPSDRSPATFRQAAQTDNCGSAPMGVARCHLAGLEIRGGHHEGVDR